MFFFILGRPNRTGGINDATICYVGARMRGRGHGKVPKTLAQMTTLIREKAPRSVIVYDVKP